MDAGDGAGEEQEEAASGRDRILDLFPPGPLIAIKISPPEIALAPGRERRVLGVGVDESGRRVLGELDIVWTTASPVLSIAGEGRRPAVLASANARPGSRFSLVAEGQQGERRARGEAVVVIIKVEEPGARNRPAVGETAGRGGRTSRTSAVLRTGRGQTLPRRPLSGRGSELASRRSSLTLRSG